ncbi:MAG TPA: ice-binding family protein [Chthoniobacterales bacterium]|nr:ice-binding family protein [Chthoniobacterales bacterium]
MNNRIISLPLRLVPGFFLGLAAFGPLANQTRAQSLGAAENFAVLGASTVTNTGASLITGSVGVSPGSAITGFPPGVITNGALHATDGPATQAHADFATAYAAYAGLASPPANNLTGTDLGGKTLRAGVYRYNVAATSHGALTFDAQNDPNARFVVQIGTTLTTSSNSSVVLINGAMARNVYFQVGESATLGSGSSFIGNILAYGAITTVSGTEVTGRLFALTEAVTLDTNRVTSPPTIRGDFNRDGFTDFLLFSPSTLKTAVWNLQGRAYLNGVHGPTLPAGWVAACVADFNLDSKPDMVLFNASTRQTAVWLLDYGTYTGGSFAPSIPTGWALVAAADMNYDGRPDYVLFNASTSRTAVWFLNGTILAGSGPGPALPAGWKAVDAVDFNADGKPDFLLANSQTHETALWYLTSLSHTGGSYGPSLPAGWAVEGAADFNGDGKLDYVLSEQSTQRTAMWYLNGGIYTGGGYGPTLAVGYILVSP